MRASKADKFYMGMLLAIICFCFGLLRIMDEADARRAAERETLNVAEPPAIVAPAFQPVQTVYFEPEPEPEEPAAEMFNPYNRAEVSEKAPTLSTGSMVTSSCAVLVVDGAVIKAAAPPMQVNEATKLGYTVIQPGECVDLAMPQSKTRRGRAMKDKTNCLTTSCDFYEYCGTLDAPIYQVRDGMITVKGQEYPIKLRDGCYIIRKLTVRECMRLQTVPETYVFPVSPSQAYKMLGNGWTVDVIAHIMGHFKGLAAGPVEVLSMYDGMSCGHIALDKLGVEIASYHATEIDKFAVQTTQANFPDVVQLGDAFQVREDGWTYAGLTGGTSEAAE